MAALLLAAEGCGGGSGGVTSAGGILGSGGAIGSGGNVSSGGASSSGGGQATGGSGGATAAGGAPATGGTRGSGGATPAGGSVASDGGVGGTAGPGGANPSGGTSGNSGGAAEKAGGVSGSDAGPGSGGASDTGGVGGTGGGGTVARGGSDGAGSDSATSTGGSANGGASASGGAQAGGTTGAGGAGGTSGATRVGGACKAGASYPAPVLTGTPTLVYKPSGTAESGTYEGPVWLSASSILLFSDLSSVSGSVDPSQMWKVIPPSTVATYLADSGTNGMAVDGSGVVFACSHKVQGIVKLDFANVTLTTVVDNIGGKKFNSPNDLTVRSDGTIYFTDPDFQLGNRTSATGKKGIYRVAPDKTVSLVDDTFAEPNGIALSPDETVLYVADYNGNLVRTFAVAADGSTGGRQDFVSVETPDGFAVDCLGNLYVASGKPGAIQVYAPSGSKLGSITVAASLSNMAFGGPDGKTLYITAGQALYSLDMNLPGYYD